MPVEIGPEWDPLAHDYSGGYTTGPGKEMAVVMGLTTLAAFGVIGVGAFVAAGEAAGVGITINGTTYYGVSQQTAQALAAIGDGAMTVEAANGVTAAAIMGGGSALDAAALVALDAYNDSQSNQPGHVGFFWDITAYLDYVHNHMGDPPGTAGGPGGGGNGTPRPGGFWVCFIDPASGAQLCTFYPF